MCGRYGLDKLTGFLILLNLLLNGIGSFMRNRIAYYIFYVLALAVFVFAVFRVLSRNIEKRRREGEWFDNLLVRTNYTESFRKMKRSTPARFAEINSVFTFCSEEVDFCLGMSGLTGPK